MVELRRQFPGKAEVIPEIRDFLRVECRRAWNQKTDDVAISNLELAVSETASNIVLHGLQGQPDTCIEVMLSIGNDQACVTFQYSGCAFEPRSAPSPDFSGRAECGYGLYLIQQSVDETHFSRDDAGLCTIRLIKHRQ